jgi:DNA-binding phage protein
MRGGLSRMEAMKVVARQRGISKRDVYKSLQDGVASKHEK